MRTGRIVDAVVVGYLLGTIPSADLAAHRASGGTVDLRTAGSGNPGGTNAMKVLGPRYGLMVMAADIGKGAAAGAVGRALAGRTGSHLACTAAVVGHCFPIWSGGKGGKGVATGVGQCLATFPAYFPINGGIALATFAVPRWRQRSYAATTVSCVCWVLGALVWWRRGHHNAWGPTPTVALPVAAAASSAVILYKFASASPPEVRGAEAVEGVEGVDA